MLPGRGLHAPDHHARSSLYTVVLVAVTLLFAPVAHMGLALHGDGRGARRGVPRHGGPAVAPGPPGPADRRRDAMRLFGYSITYLTVLFVAMAVDVLVRYH